MGNRVCDKEILLTSLCHDFLNLVVCASLINILQNSLYSESTVLRATLRLTLTSLTDGDTSLHLDEPD